MSLLPFELKKILFSKKFLYISIGIVVAVIFILTRNIIFQSYIEKDEQENINDLLDISYENSKVHRSIIDNNPDDEEEQNRLLMNHSLVDILYERRTLIGTDDWQNKLTLENEYLNLLTEYKAAEGDHPLTETEINRMITLNQKLMDEGIPPEHDTYSIALPNFMKQVVDFFIHFGAILLVILLVGEIMSSEFENRSANLLFTQPLKRTHIITSKFISSIIVYLLATFILIGAVFIIGSIFGEKGTFNYPLLMEENNELGFMPIFEYMTLGIIVISVMVVMLIGLSIFYSLFFKNTLPTLFAVLITLILGYVITTFISWSPLAWFNPFQYLLPEDIILFQNESQWYQGIPVTLILAIIFYLIAREKVKTSKVD